MNRTWIAAILLVSLGAAATLAGCGYTTATQYRTDVKTIAVPIFRRASDEFRRDIEIRLTEAVKKRIDAETPYKVVDRSRADTILIGTLRRATLRPLSFDTRTGGMREAEVRLSLDFTWKDLRGEGKVLVEQKDFRVAANFIPPEPFSEDFFLGSEDAINRLSQLIVEELARPW